MKKLIYILMAFFTLATVSVAQTPTKAPAKPTQTAKPATPKAAPAKTTTKKDGTADMRMKGNKKAAKPAGPLKKDGTPDMRYKANKTTTKKK